jgi:hypothetical protein
LETLRELLIQRAARLQEWTALTAPGWDSLRYPAFRNRVEGVALGLMALDPPLGARRICRTGGPWDWACEVACACCGLVWAEDGEPVGQDVLGGPLFNAEAGRQTYHDREHGMSQATPLIGALDHGELLRRLRRLNGKLGWDHSTTVTLPLADLASPEVRGALWSALYAGSHAILAAKRVAGWEPEGFRGVLGSPLPGE